MFGVFSALETLAPQAMGAGRPAEVGLLCQRGFVICMGVLVVAMPLWYNMEAVLLWFSMPPTASYFAGRFLKNYM